jgi:hypothetical protein
MDIILPPRKRPGTETVTEQTDALTGRQSFSSRAFSISLSR